jgi:hypothetical protein
MVNILLLLSKFFDKLQMLIVKRSINWSVDVSVSLVITLYCICIVLVRWVYLILIRFNYTNIVSSYFSYSLAFDCWHDRARNARRLF